MINFFSFILYSVDLFPVPLQITYRRRNSYSTKVSNLMSVCLLSLILYLVVVEAYYTISLVNPQINTVMVQGKKAEPFQITADDFYVLTNFTFNGSSFHINQSQGQIFNLSVEECRYDSNFQQPKCKTRSMVRCSEANVPSKLMKEMNLNETNLQDNYCLNYTQLAQDPLQLQINYISQVYINVILYQCNNSTENLNIKGLNQFNQGCADQQIIDFYINSGQVVQNLIYAAKTPNLNDLNEPYMFKQMNKSLSFSQIESQVIMTQMSPQFLDSKENPFLYFGKQRYFKALVQDNDANLSVPAQRYLSNLIINYGPNSISSIRTYDNILNVVARYKSLLDVAIIFLFPLIGTYNKYSLNQSLIKKINQDNEKSPQIFRNQSTGKRAVDQTMISSLPRVNLQKSKFKQKLIVLMDRIKNDINKNKLQFKSFINGNTICNLHMDIIQVVETVKDNKNSQKSNNYNIFTNLNRHILQISSTNRNGIEPDLQNQQLETYDQSNPFEQPYVPIFKQDEMNRLNVSQRNIQLNKPNQAVGDQTV